MSKIRLRPPVHWTERIRVISYLLVYTFIAERGQPSPFLQSPVGKITWGLVVLYVAKEFVRYGEEQSTHFYATTNRLRARWEKRKGRFSDYSRYRIGRIVRYAFWTVALGYLIDGATDKCTGTIGCATAIPALVVQNFQTILFMALNIAMGFAGLFLMMWVLARMDLYQVIHPASIRTRFSDVYGQDKAVARMRENLFLLENPEVVEKRGGYMPGGLLLVGPPGTGKSLLAEALAGETGKPFVSVGPESFTNMFVGVPIMKVKMLYRHLRKLSVKHGGVVCVAPETLVLTDDLRWVRADTLQPEDGIFGVDEKGKREHGGRRTRLGVVEAVEHRTDQRYRLVTDRGSIVVNGEHPFLARDYPLGTPKRHGGLVWRPALLLNPGDHIKWLADPWESEDGDSWLAGMYDGEGHITGRDFRGVGRGLNVGISQNVGPVEQRIGQELDRRGFGYSLYLRKAGAHGLATSDLHTYELTNLPMSLRLLGMVRPQRLLEQYHAVFSGDNPPRLPNNSWATVEAIEPVGYGPIVSIQTSTRTFVADGFVTHNCFFDEIDALGSRGGGVLEQAARVVLSTIGRLVGLSDEMVITGGGVGSGALQMVLSEMSGLAKPRGLYNKIRVLIGFEPVPPPHYRILHVGATNRADDLDPALLRPGRYDRHIKVGRPNADGIAETLRGYLAKLDDHNVTDQEIQTLAKENPGATGASIKDIVNEALLTTIREERTTVTAKDIREALIWKRMGEDRGRQTVEDDHRRVCLHEASHAVVAHHFRQRSQIQYASIVMRDRNLGVVSSAPIEERHTRPRSEIEADIRVALASVWAERHFFEGDLSTGPSSDLEKATEQAAGMVARFAMDEYLSVSKLPFDQLPDEQKDAVNRLLQRLYDETDLFLSDRVDQIEAVAALLDVQSTVDGVEIHDLLAGMEAA
jgi:ATP-dependent Zn protease